VKGVFNLWGIGIVRDDDDVLSDHIDHALRFCDRIYYLDNNSIDGCWETLQAKAEQYPGRVFAEHFLGNYSQGVRREIYNRYNRDLPADHWWMKLDADEFLHADPRPTIRSAMGEGADAIVVWQVQFQYTEVDHARYLRGEDDPSIPIHERRRFYRTNWREPRFFRNFPDASWDDDSMMHPEQVSRYHSERPLNRHYQFRSPAQIQHRLELRKASPHFAHVTHLGWESELADSATCSEWLPGTDPKIHHLRFLRAKAGVKLIAPFSPNKKNKRPKLVGR
jgi:hypothetical protein